MEELILFDYSCIAFLDFVTVCSGFSLSGGNRYNLPLQATVLRTSYRLQSLEGSLKLYKLF